MNAVRVVAQAAAFFLLGYGCGLLTASAYIHFVFVRGKRRKS